MSSLPDRYRTALGAPGPRGISSRPGSHRRRAVTAGTLAVGVPLNAWALRIEPGDPTFYPATAALGAVWLGGALASGPLHLGHEPGEPDRRPVTSSLALAAGLVVVFTAGAVVIARIEPLRTPVEELLAHATQGNLPAIAVLTAVNGVAEECFHRGAVYAAAEGCRPVLTSTALYTAVTATAGIPLLALAGAMLGAVTGLQRRATGGVLAPTLTHVAWSSTMLLGLRPIIEWAKPAAATGIRRSSRRRTFAPRG